MIRRWSYLNNLNNLINISGTFTQQTLFLRFRQVVYLNVRFFFFSKLIRKRLLRKKHLNQFIYFNNIFYMWVTQYTISSNYGKKQFHSNSTLFQYVCFPLLPLTPSLHSFFFITKRRINTFLPPLYCLTAKFKFHQIDIESEIMKMEKASPLVAYSQGVLIPYSATLNRCFYLYNIQFELFVNLYLIYLKEYYLTLQLLFKC